MLKISQFAIPDNEYVRRHLDTSTLVHRSDFDLTPTMVANARAFHKRLIDAALRGRTPPDPHTWVHADVSYDVTGFHRLGGGLYRSVYRRGSYVYKFSTIEPDGDMNHGEHQFFTSLREQGYTWLIPPTHMVDTILIMPYYKLKPISNDDYWSYYEEGYHSTRSDVDAWNSADQLAYGIRRWMIDAYAYDDAHYENLLIDKATNTPVLVDGGMSQLSYQDKIDWAFD
jgi:hypothetical protein